jgi:hypothetical protein
MRRSTPLLKRPYYSRTSVDPYGMRARNLGLIRSDRQSGSDRIPRRGTPSEYSVRWVLAALRQLGVPMRRIRPAVAALQQAIGIGHALAPRQRVSNRRVDR